MGTTVPDAVKRLVDRFDQDRKVFQSPDYKEEQLRAEFLNPFFESLGWDVANKAGLTEVFKPVIHEEPSRSRVPPKPRATPPASTAAVSSVLRPRSRPYTSPTTPAAA